MPRFVGPETVEVWWVATIADPAAPTSAELNAGVDLTGFLPDGGIELPQTANVVDASDGSSLFNKTVRGTYGGDQATITAHRDNVQGNDTAFSTLVPGSAGFIAIAPRGLATPGTWAVGDQVDVYPVEVLNREPVNILARNATNQFRSTLAITDDPTIDYTLAT